MTLLVEPDFGAGLSEGIAAFLQIGEVIYSESDSSRSRGVWDLQKSYEIILYDRKRSHITVMNSCFVFFSPNAQLSLCRKLLKH